MPAANSASLTDSGPHAPLGTRDRLFLAVFFVTIFLFGVLVEIRSNFLSRRQTDLNVYLRAAWAVRTDADIYDITDDNDWHYQYPPLFAILLVPFADPPHGAEHAGYVPFGLTAGLWYLFNLGCLAYAAHHFAGILEESSRHAGVRSLPIGCQRWWRLRIIPVVVCLIPIGQSLTRGQVSLVLLALLAGTIAAMYRGQGWRAGFWLAGAICLKVIPAFLLLVPLWQRNYRCLAGCLAGLFVGLLLVPAAVFGLPRTLQYYAEYDRKVLRPGMGKEEDASRAEELTRVTSTDSQSLVAMIHNTIHIYRATRPLDATRTVRGIHWILGALLTLVTLRAARRKLHSALALVLFLSALIFNMLILSPVCHLHYYCLQVPMVMGLLAWKWEREGTSRVRGPLLIAFALNICASLLPVIAQELDRGIEQLLLIGVLPSGVAKLPPLVTSRDIGVATYGAALLWILTCVALRRSSKQVQELPVPATLPVANIVLAPRGKAA